MNNFKFYLKLSLIIMYSLINHPAVTPTTPTNTTVKYSNNSNAYTDIFGPLQTGYTMGDLMAFSIWSNYNVYNGIVASPYLTACIFNYNKNYRNLYNALGYLYAGFLAGKEGSNINFDDWINHEKTLDIDNNVENQYALEIPLTAEGNTWTKIDMCTYTVTPKDGSASFGNIYAHYSRSQATISPLNTSSATSSYGWCSNPSNGSYIAAFGESISYPSQQNAENKFQDYYQDMQNADDDSNAIYVPSMNKPSWDNSKFVPNAYVYPLGQFFGARIAHILGAVVNDVPFSTSNDLSNASGGTGSFNNSLISGSSGTGTALPMIAVMNNNSAGWKIRVSGSQATSNAPAEMFQPSTAHFGSINTFLSQLTTIGLPSILWNYLPYHLTPTVTRLSLLCSYKLNSNNLIEIADSAVTPYDNGIILSIQNNTGDQLQINQITSSTSKPTNPIGVLNQGNNNYYLHTASLMNGVTTPDASQMISIIDNSNDIIGGTYIQVLSATQLQNLYTAINSTLTALTINGQNLPTLVYNQIMSGYTVPKDPFTTPAYIVVTNFNPTLNSNNALSSLNLPTDTNSQADILNSCRIQAINVAEFDKKPYYLTIQINKEQLGYGIKTNYNATNNTKISSYSLSSGSSNSSILLPSVKSVDICTCINYVDSSKNQSGVAAEHFNYMPILMIPDQILSKNLENLDYTTYWGLMSYYGIWLMAYYAAMTGFKSNIDIPNSNIKVLRDQATNLPGNTITQANLIIDQQGSLLSGKTVQSSDVSLCACDTWDSGGGFNQDIPILNLYKDANQNVILNKEGQPYINYIITIPDNSTKHTVLFSVPTAAVKSGINLEFELINANLLELQVTNTNDFIDNEGNNISSGSLLAMKQIYTSTPPSIGYINYLGGNANQTSHFELKTALGAKSNIVLYNPAINEKINLIGKAYYSYMNKLIKNNAQAKYSSAIPLQDTLNIQDLDSFGYILEDDNNQSMVLNSESTNGFTKNNFLSALEQYPEGILLKITIGFDFTKNNLEVLWQAYTQENNPIDTIKGQVTIKNTSQNIDDNKFYLTAQKNGQTTSSAIGWEIHEGDVAWYQLIKGENTLTTELPLNNFSIGINVSTDTGQPVSFKNNTHIATTTLIANGKAVNPLGTALLNALEKRNLVNINISYDTNATGLSVSMNLVDQKNAVLQKSTFNFPVASYNGMPQPEAEYIFTWNSESSPSKTKSFNETNSYMTATIIGQKPEPKKSNNIVIQNKKLTSKTNKKIASVNKSKSPKTISTKNSNIKN